jgi:hypothetical protein
MTEDVKNDRELLQQLTRDVACIGARLSAEDQLRKELREQDDYLRQNMVFQLSELRKDVHDLTVVVYDAPNMMDRKIGEIHAEVRELAHAVQESPAVVDHKLAALRAEREAVTAPTIRAVDTARAFGIVLAKLGTGAGVITGVVLGIGKLFGWY